MKSYGLNELRKMYLDFFESKNHLKMNSFPLVPKNDKSLLLINAGMTPLKPYFTGQETPPSKRVTTCQKCIRTGDIENVGKTARHLTYFEMLGNFSFGDYFKTEAINWAWEFFTEVLEIPKELLYVSVYEDDDEAERLWHENVNLPLDRIVRLGKEDNFWEHGAGPCGPCSEIHIDRGEKYGCGSPDCGVECECDRYVEVWNLVFTQFEKTEDGEYIDLPNPNIDTGMGLERLAVIMQDVDTVFDVDTFKAVRDDVCALASVEYQSADSTDVSIRVITDHIRSVSFMISDGILPSNEGRGYVLRRLLRRAARHGKLLGIKGGFLTKLAEKVIETSKDAYPELLEKSDYIIKIISVEEERFAETIDQGLSILKTYMEEMVANKTTVLSGDKAFKLYDTYGFPLDLTLEIVEENSMSVDEDGFHKEMEAQRVRAREAREETNYMGAKETVYSQLDVDMATIFVGYDNLEFDSTVTAITTEENVVDHAYEGDTVSIFVAETPFYATSGGQHADRGVITTDTATIAINDVKKVGGNKFAHIGTITSGEIKTGDTVRLSVDKANRMATAKNHSTTHLLQKALKNVLGNHIEQAGSNVNEDRLRFDFTHFQGMIAEEIQQVEDEVNQNIMAGLNVETKVMAIDEAKKMGAMALFGEKYGDSVRVVTMGDYSMELCGGTHIKNTSEAGIFKIISEQGVAAGVRRIEALTSETAINYYKDQEALIKKVASLVKSDSASLINKVEHLLADMKALQSENEKLKSSLASSAVDELLDNAEEINGIKVLVTKISDSNMDALRDMGDKFKEKLGSCAIVLATANGGKVNLIAMASDEAIKAGVHAGNIIKETAKVVGGGGGGRPNMAQAGGKKPEQINEALEKALDIIKGQIG